MESSWRKLDLKNRFKLISQSLSKVDYEWVEPRINKDRILDFPKRLRDIKYGWAMSQTNITTATFRISRGGTSVIYGFLFSEYYEGEFHHQYLATGSTFTSRDGEFRKRFIPYDNFVKFLEANEDLAEQAEEQFLKILEDGTQRISTDLCYAPFLEAEQQDEYKKIIDGKRFAINIYIANILADFAYMNMGIIEKHVSQDYLFNINPLDYPDLQSLTLSDGLKCIKLMEGLEDDKYTVMCGHKNIPMTMAETIEQENILFMAWRELYITNLCSSLCANGYTGGFPIVSNWFYIHNSGKRIYDNFSIHERYGHSIIAQNIESELNKSINLTHDKRTDRPINTKFQRLEEYIKNAVNYGRRGLVLTDLSLSIILENVGHTFRNAPYNINSDPTQFGLIKTFTTERYFMKIMFEYIYNCYLMNIKLGVIHADIHLNNITLYNYSSRCTGTTMYVVGDKKYIFDSCGIQAMIIDFSRALILDKKLLRNDYGKRIEEELTKEQEDKIYGIFHAYLPTLIEENKTRLRWLFKNDLELVVKVLSGIDSVMIIRNIYNYVRTGEIFTDGKYQVPDSTIKKLKEMYDYVDLNFTKNINLMLNEMTKSEDVEWINYNILEEFFDADYLLDKSKKITIDNYYSMNTPFKYRIDEHAPRSTWGPIISMEKFFDMHREKNIPVDPKWKNWQRVKTLDEHKEFQWIRELYTEQV